MPPVAVSFVDLLQPAQLIPIVLAFFLAGLVKGVVGLGLPSVVLGILTLTLGLKPAMALLLFPAFVTNVWQALQGPALRAILTRTWPMLLAIGAGAWLGVGVLASSDAALMAALLGLMIAAYGVMGLTRPALPSPGRHEVWLSPVVGIVHGVLTGMTGSFQMPGLPYLQAIGFDREALIQAMGVLFAVSTLALALAMSDHRLLSVELAGASVAAIVPAMAGMWLGQRVRHRLSEAAFKRTLFGSLIAMGAFIMWRAV